MHEATFRKSVGIPMYNEGLTGEYHYLLHVVNA